MDDEFAKIARMLADGQTRGTTLLSRLEDAIDLLNEGDVETAKVAVRAAWRLVKGIDDE